LVLVGLLGWAIAIARIVAVSAQAQTATIVNSASYATDVFAPESMASAYGSFVTTNNQTFVAPSAQLPATLGGIRVTVGGIDAGMILAGFWQDRKGPRVVASAGGFLLGTGCLLAAWIGDTVGGLVVAYGVVAALGVGFAYVTPIGVGDVLPEESLFVTSEIYVKAPLESTYETAWRAAPEALRRAVETACQVLYYAGVPVILIVRFLPY